MCPNDMCPNDMCPDDMCHDDMCPNAICPNDMCPNGMCPNDMCPNDMCPNDMCPNDMCPNDTYKTCIWTDFKKLKTSLQILKTFMKALCDIFMTIIPETVAQIALFKDCPIFVCSNDISSNNAYKACS
jgi:hypothetical protein